MKKLPHVFPVYIVNLFFVIGLMSAIAFRTIVVLNDVNPTLVRPIWYTGAFGYMLFFMYRFFVSKKRKRAIKEYNLIEKLNQNHCLTEVDREVTVFLLESVERSRENLNYLFIFIFSVAAIMVDLLLKI